MEDYTGIGLAGRGSARMETGRGRWWRARDATDRDPFRRLFSYAPAPIVMLDGYDLIVERANEAAFAVVGDRKMIGRPLLDVLPELVGQGCLEVLREVMMTGIPHVGEEALIGLGETGTSIAATRYWTYTCAPARHEDGEPKVIVVLVDVTAQVVARRRLEEVATQAMAASRAKDQFIAMLSHELRNPLSPIVTALELLRMRGLDTEEVALMERQVGCLARLVDDLLDMTRIARGKLTLQKQPTEAADIVSAAVEMVSPLLKGRDHRLVIDTPPGCTIDVDAERMSQVVCNLLTNAARYSEPGTVIAVSGERRGGSVRLSVKDQGIGIEAESLEAVFDAFEQHHRTGDRSNSGLGLGLAIVRNLVRLHGGEVRAYSDGLGTGSEFVITLPWVEPARKEVTHPS